MYLVVDREIIHGFHKQLSLNIMQGKLTVAQLNKTPRLELTIDFTDAGTYTCSATKDGVTDSAEFDVSPPPIVPGSESYAYL